MKENWRQRAGKINVMRQAMLVLLICWAAPQNSVADEATLALGAFDISGSADVLMQAEYAPDAEWMGMRPQLGLFVAEQSSGYLYAGLG